MARLQRPSQLSKFLDSHADAVARTGQLPHDRTSSARSIPPNMTLEISQPAHAQVVVITGRAEVVTAVSTRLRDAGTVVVQRRWDAAGDARMRWERPDLVVLDAADPGDCVARIQYLRRRWPTLYVAVTGAEGVREVRQLMAAGADDAVAACSPSFVSRLRAAARRASIVNASIRIAVGDIVFERETHRVWCAGREIRMAPRELGVLDCLFWHAPNVVSPEVVLDFVWGDAPITTRRGVVEVYIGYLRRKLAASRTVVIGTVRGAGYRFEARG